MNQPKSTKTNAASRLHIIFSKIEKLPNYPMVDIWHQIFIRKESDQFEKWMEAAKIASKIYDEIVSLERSLHEIIPKEDYFSEIQGMKTIASVQYLGNSYTSLKGNLPDGFLRVLKGYSRELGDKENSATDHQLASISESLNELKNNLASSLTDETLIAVIKKYILLIESAIIDYEIIGGKAFVDAYKQAMYITIENKTTLQENKNTSIIEKIGELFGKIKDVIKTANQGSEILRIGQEVFEKITS